MIVFNLRRGRIDIDLQLTDESDCVNAAIRWVVVCDLPRNVATEFGSIFAYEGNQGSTWWMR